MTDAPGVEAARRAVAPDEAVWLVGGAVRDRRRGRPTTDIDLVTAGDAAALARRLSRVSGGAAFPLSESFGAWRVMAPDRSWQADVSALAGKGIEEDLARRDFTVNALAEPLRGGEVIDPWGGLADLQAGRLRMVNDRAFAADALRVLRLARLACELGLQADPDTIAAARAHAPGLGGVAGERVFGELKRIVTGDRALEGLAVMDAVGATDVVLPELSAQRGIEQNIYHHLDVHDHSVGVLARLMELEREPRHALGEHAEVVDELLRRPLADELTRWQGLRFGALLHDAAKPHTRRRLPGGRVTFVGHDEQGAELARRALTRLRASERLRAYVAALTREHLRLGFLVHERPLSRRAVHRYLRGTGPVAVDVTVLSIADRLATRGRNADAAIAGHLEVARELLAEAVCWDRDGPPAPLVRGDELAGALGVAPGPEIGRLLEELEAAQFAGEVRSRDEALALARTVHGRTAAR